MQWAKRNISKILVGPIYLRAWWPQQAAEDFSLAYMGFAKIAAKWAKHSSAGGFVLMRQLVGRWGIVSLPLGIPWVIHGNQGDAIPLSSLLKWPPDRHRCQKTPPLSFLSTLLAIQPARATGATNAAALQGVKDAKQTGQLKDNDNIYDPERKKPFSNARFR